VATSTEVRPAALRCTLFYDQDYSGHLRFLCTPLLQSLTRVLSAAAVRAVSLLHISRLSTPLCGHVSLCEGICWAVG